MVAFSGAALAVPPGTAGGDDAAGAGFPCGSAAGEPGSGLFRKSSVGCGDAMAPEWSVEGCPTVVGEGAEVKTVCVPVVCSGYSEVVAAIAGVGMGVP